MILLYNYAKRNKKGNITGYIKQVYAVNFDEKVIIGGMSETGYTLLFYPEGNRSNSVITEKTIETLRKIGEYDTDEYSIYLLND